MSLQLASAYGSIYTNNKADDSAKLLVTNRLYIHPSLLELFRHGSVVDQNGISTVEVYIYMYETHNYLHRTVKE